MPASRSEPWWPSSSSLSGPPTLWCPPPSRTFQRMPVIAGQPLWLTFSPPPIVWRPPPGPHCSPLWRGAHGSLPPRPAAATAGRARARARAAASPPRLDRGMAPTLPRNLFARVEQALRVQRALDGLVRAQRAAAQRAALEHAQPVLAGHRAAQPPREREQLARRLAGPVELAAVAGVDQEGRVQVPVAGVPPAQRLQAVPGADGQRLADRLGEALDGHDDVLADLPAALRADRERDAVAPAPQRVDLARGARRDDRQRSLAERLHQLALHALGLGRRAVGLADDEDPGARRRPAGEGRARRPQRARVEVLQGGGHD